jgi:DNA primase
MIDHEIFIKWANQKIGQPVINGDQIRFNSPFCEDTKHHLYCNIKKFWKGLYNCFKSNNKGTVLALVMKIDNCSYEDALQTLGIKQNKFFEKFELEDHSIDVNSLIKEEFKVIQKPNGVVTLNEAPPWLYKKAKDYLLSRKIDLNAFYVGIEGRMKNRLVIPYYDRNNNWIYYNGRALFESNLRYLGPLKDENDVGKADVMFFPTWFQKNQKIYICEGEFDCMSIQEQDLISCAVGGKQISTKHASVVANKQVCLAFDNDSAGQMAIENSAKLLKSFGCEVSSVHPPLDIKDWNEFLVRFDKNMLSQYIRLAEKQMDG